MRKIFFATALAVVSFIGANAQKGNNQVGVAFDLGIPTGDFGDAFKTGFGGQLRGLLGVGTAGQVSLTTGWSTFKEKESSGYNSKMNIIPVLLGYRHNFNGLYVEPQAGYGSYAGKSDLGDNSEGAFTWAVGLGYAKSGLDIGARYQSGQKDGSISLVGIHLGYNFTLGGASASK
jgi:predicted porin